MKPKVIVGVLAIVGFTSLLMYNFGNSISTYTNFTSAADTESNVHVVGSQVKDLPAEFSKQTRQFTFYMEDQNGDVKRVMYSKPKPNNFDQAERLVVIGRMQNDVFYANDMLMKCPSKYNDASEAEFERAQHSS